MADTSVFYLLGWNGTLREEFQLKKEANEAVREILAFSELSDGSAYDVATCWGSCWLKFPWLVNGSDCRRCNTLLAEVEVVKIE